MLVSLFTDASLCSKTGAAGWGAWAKSDRGTTSVGGPFPFKVANSGEAELLAIVRGLRMAAERGIIVAGEHDLVLVQSDNMEALGIVGSSRSRFQARAVGVKASALAEFREIAKGHGIRWTTRHVKGHADSRAATRNYVNNLCDRLAKQGMMEMRQKLGGFTRREEPPRLDFDLDPPEIKRSK